jgi:hypothetical protein
LKKNNRIFTSFEQQGGQGSCRGFTGSGLVGAIIGGGQVITTCAKGKSQQGIQQGSTQQEHGCLSELKIKQFKRDCILCRYTNHPPSPI